MTITKGSEILGATMSFAGAASAGLTVESVFDADAADDPPIMEDDAAWDAVVKTSASVPWSISTIWVVNEEYTGPEIKTVIQEKVNQANWSSGDHLTMFLHDDAGASPNFYKREWWANTYGPPTDWPQLDIDYTPAAPPAARRIFITHN